MSPFLTVSVEAVTRNSGNEYRLSAFIKYKAILVIKNLTAVKVGIYRYITYNLNAFLFKITMKLAPLTVKLVLNKRIIEKVFFRRIVS